MTRLERLLDALRDDYYEAGRGDDFEEHISRFKADGKWPFEH